MFGRMDSEFRIAMMQAAEEQKELGHELLGADHLLLGLLANVRGSAYRVFADQGVTYDWARRVVEEKHEDLEGQADDTESSSDLDEDRDALRAIGIDLDKVRDAVRETFGEDIGADWGQRRSHRGRGGRGPGRGRGPGADDWRGFGPFGDGFEGPWDRGGRGRRGPRRRGMHPMSPSLREVMRQVHGEFRHGMQDMRANLRDGRGGGPRVALVPAVLTALLDSDDPAVRAVIDAADDPKALRAAVSELAGRATA